MGLADAEAIATEERRQPGRRGRRRRFQEELGRRSGLHRAHVGEIERGEISPTLDSVQLIADALGVTPSELIAVAEKHPP